MPTADSASGAFSLVRGGPFHALQGRLGLLGLDGLPTIRSALLSAATAWIPLALLASSERHAWGPAYGASLFTDFGAYARLVIAVVLFTATERMVDQRIGRLLEAFERGGLLGTQERPRFLALLRRADRWTSSTVAEAVVFVLAFGLSLFAALRSVRVTGESWQGLYADGAYQLSIAGWWSVLVSMPLFWFLLLRWLWRFACWTALLRRIAGLRLNLVASHPDRAAGLGFLELYPQMFTPFAFALSCVMASAALQEVVFAEASFEDIRAFGLGWAVVVVLIFTGPLVVFVPTLSRLKERALLDYAALASRHNLAAERVLMQAEDMEGQVLGSPIISSLADLGATFETVRSLKPLPFRWSALIPLIGAALFPMLAVAAVKVPLLDLLRKIATALM